MVSTSTTVVLDKEKANMNENLAMLLLFGIPIYCLIGYAIRVDAEGPELAAWIIFWPIIGLALVIHQTWLILCKIWSE